MTDLRAAALQYRGDRPRGRRCASCSPRRWRARAELPAAVAEARGAARRPARPRRPTSTRWRCGCWPRPIPRRSARRAYAETVLAAADLSRRAPADDPARTTIARQLVALGLPDPALAMIAPALAAGAAPARLVAAEARIRLGQPDAAQAALGTLAGPEFGDGSAPAPSRSPAPTTRRRRRSPAAGSRPGRRTPGRPATGRRRRRRAGDPERQAMAAYMAVRGRGRAPAPGRGPGEALARTRRSSSRCRPRPAEPRRGPAAPRHRAAGRRLRAGRAGGQLRGRTSCPHRGVGSAISRRSSCFKHPRGAYHRAARNAAAERSVARHPPLPRARRVVGAGAELGDERFERGEVVAGEEVVDVRQHRAHAARPRLEAVAAQQRVEPDQPARRTGAAAPSRRASRAVSSRSSPSVISSTTAPCPSTRRDQWRLKSCRQAPMRVPPAQSCASRPRRGERGVGVALAELAGDVGEPRAEDEGVHCARRRAALQRRAGSAAASASSGDIEPEMSQSTTRFGQPRPPRPACASRCDVAAACAAPPASSPRQSATGPRGSGRVRRLASGRNGSHQAAIARRAAASSSAIICSKSAAQTLVGREGERRVDLDLVVLGRRCRGGCAPSSRAPRPRAARRRAARPAVRRRG